MQPPPRWIVGLSGEEEDFLRLSKETDAHIWREDGDWLLTSPGIEALNDAIPVTREAERLVAAYGITIRNVTEFVPEKEGYGTVVRSPFETVYMPARFPWRKKG